MSTGGLVTSRLALRRFRDDDAERLVDLDSHPEVMRYLSGGKPTPRSVIEGQVLPAFMAWDEDYPTFGTWAAETRGDGAFIGWFSLRPSDETHGDLVLGFRLRRPVWGRGYATEGARALVDRAFGDPDVQRIVGTTYEDNVASRRVMEKIGMRFVRAFRLSADDLAHVDTYDATSTEAWDGHDVEYALNRGRWERLRTGPG